jgi:hypothetical protein
MKTFFLSQSFFHWVKHMEGCTLICLFSCTSLSTVWILFSVLDVDGLPDLASSHTEVLPFLKWSVYSYILLRDKQLSPYWACIRRIISTSLNLPQTRIESQSSFLLSYKSTTELPFLTVNYDTLTNDEYTTLNQRSEYEQCYHPTEREIKIHLLFDLSSFWFIPSCIQFFFFFFEN